MLFLFLHPVRCSSVSNHTLSNFKLLECLLLCTSLVMQKWLRCNMQGYFSTHRWESNIFIYCLSSTLVVLCGRNIFTQKEQFRYCACFKENIRWTLTMIGVSDVLSWCFFSYERCCDLDYCMADFQLMQARLGIPFKDIYNASC